MQTSDPYGDRADRATLADETGKALLVFSRSESVRDATPWAASGWVPDPRRVADAAEAAVQAMAGWLLSTSDASLVTRLRARGATETRHTYRMTHDLRSTAAPPQSSDVAAPRSTTVHPLTAAQALRSADRLAAVILRAYQRGHPDAFDADETTAVRQVRATALGEVLGPMLTSSRVAVYERRIVGACFVVERPGAAPHGGPWAVDLFRDPHCPEHGVGEALLRSALAGAVAAGLPTLSLTVTAGNNRARALYRRVGFVATNESWTLALP